MRAPPSAPENVTGLKAPSVCHVRHEQKRLDLNRVQTTTYANRPKPLLFALYVTVCHVMSSNVREHHGVSALSCAHISSFILHPSSLIPHPCKWLRLAHSHQLPSGRLGSFGRLHWPVRSPHRFDGNHRCSDRADIACRLRAFAPLGEIANGFVRNQGFRAGSRQTRCLIIWLQLSMAGAASGSLCARRLTSL
jgi:hypothetical protein